MRRFIKLIACLYVFLSAGVCFCGDDVVLEPRQIAEDFRAAFGQVRKKDRDIQLTRFAEKYFGPSTSTEERVLVIEQLKKESFQPPGRPMRNELITFVASLMDVTFRPQNREASDLRDSISSALVSSFKSPEDLDFYVHGDINFTNGVLNSATDMTAYFDDLKTRFNQLSKKHMDHLFWKGLELFKSAKDSETSPSVANLLMRIAPQVSDSWEMSKEDIKLLLTKGELNEAFQDFVLKRHPKEACELFLSFLESQSLNFDDLIKHQWEHELKPIRHFTEILSDKSRFLSKEGLERLRAIALNNHLDPQAREIALQALKEREPESLKKISSQLFDSKEPIDHHLASQFLGNEPDKKAVLVKKLQQDLLNSADPRVQELLVDNPMIKEASWGHRKFTKGEEAGIVRMLEESKKFDVVSEALKVIKENPDDLAGLLLKVLKKGFNDEDSDGWLRSHVNRLAETFGELVKKKPEILTGEVEKDLLSILASKDPKLSEISNDLRKFLPEEKVAALDREVTRRRLDPSNEDPCAVTCRIAEDFSKQIDGTLNIETDSAGRGPGVGGVPDWTAPFDFAVRSLMAEFLVKAENVGCAIPKLKQQISTLLEGANDHAKSQIMGGDRSPQNTDATYLQQALAGSGASDNALKSAIAFMERIKKSDNVEGATGLPTSTPTLYFYIHTLRALEALKKAGQLSDSKALEDLRTEVEAQLGKIVAARGKLEQAKGWGSFVNTYALSAIGASLPEGSPLKEKVAKVLSDLRADIEQSGGRAFPYFPKIEREEPPQTQERLEISRNPPAQIIPDQFLERGGAARSVVAQLAIYQGGSSTERLANADKLLLSLSTYDKHFHDIFSGIGRARTHDSDKDHLAPYYGPSTIPYVFEAISSLGKEASLSSDQKKQLASLKTSILNKLLGMFQSNGLFQPQHSGQYAGARHYDNALAGLAVEQACRDSKKTKASDAPTLDRVHEPEIIPDH